MTAALDREHLAPSSFSDPGSLQDLCISAESADLETGVSESLKSKLYSFNSPLNTDKIDLICKR